MFPIVHYFANLYCYKEVPPLMALGGLFPDLASSAGLERNAAHEMGAPFFNWCLNQAPEAIPLARGIISHGIMPFGVDYYADENWPGCERGWCFEEGRPWIERIATVTHLPERLLWWKSHNFVEMSYELLTIKEHPQIGLAIMEALQDEALLVLAAEVLSRYTGGDKQAIIDIYHRAPRIFALAEVSAQALAIRQDSAYRRRHNIFDADIPGMAALLQEMSENLQNGYAYYMPEANKLVKEMLSGY